MKKIQLSILSIATILFLNSCYYDNFKELHPANAIVPSACDTVLAISYSTQIVPIINAACVRCHNSTGSAHDMTTYTSVYNDAITFGYLYNSVAQDGTVQPMPEGASKLSDCDITKIKKWVAAGAPNN